MPAERDAIVVGFNIEPEVRDKLDQMAKEQDRSRSWIIRQLLLRALASNEKTA